MMRCIHHFAQSLFLQAVLVFDEGIHLEESSCHLGYPNIIR